MFLRKMSKQVVSDEMVNSKSIAKPKSDLGIHGGWIGDNTDWAMDKKGSL